MQYSHKTLCKLSLLTEFSEVLDILSKTSSSTYTAEDLLRLKKEYSVKWTDPPLHQVINWPATISTKSWLTKSTLFIIIQTKKCRLNYLIFYIFLHGQLLFFWLKRLFYSYFKPTFWLWLQYMTPGLSHVDFLSFHL